MWQIDEDDLVRFRCHIGHAYTPELMALALDESLRRALASARRGLAERVLLMASMEKRAITNGHKQLAQTWRQKGAEYRDEAKLIDEAIQRLERLAAEPEPASS
jgi:two-component system chemotaxis response regulator CheB